MITQIFIMIFGASAIWFVSRKEDWKRWGYILGMLGQPFWIYESYTNEQWGILLMTLVYAYSWMQGVWNYWLFPSKETLVPNLHSPDKNRTLELECWCKTCGQVVRADLNRVCLNCKNKIDA